MDHEQAPTNPITLRDAKQQAEGLIAVGYAEGLIDDDELERRLEALQDVDSMTALDGLVGDLAAQVRAPDAGYGLTVPGPITSVALARADDILPTRRIVAMFASVEQRGSWVPARTNRVIDVFAEAELDFRDAQLGPGETRIELRCVFASARLIIPPGLAVRVEASVVMGAVERDHGVVERPHAPNDPILVITGLVLFASVEICERLPGERNRDARKRHRRARREAKQLRRAAKRERKRARKLGRDDNDRRALRP